MLRAYYILMPNMFLEKFHFFCRPTANVFVATASDTTKYQTANVGPLAAETAETVMRIVAEYGGCPCTIQVFSSRKNIRIGSSKCLVVY